MKASNPDRGPSEQRKSLSERHARHGKRGTQMSLGLSIFLHGALAAALVGTSLYAGKAPVPRRLYSVNFGGDPGATTSAVAQEMEEVLEAPTSIEEEGTLEWTAGGWNEIEVALRPEPIRKERFEVAPAESFAEHLLSQDFVGPRAPVTLVQPMAEPPLAGDSLVDEIEDAPIDAEIQLYTPLRSEGEDAPYPRLSLRLQEQGDARLRLTLDDEGRVRGVELIQSSGFPRLDEAAMSAAPKWRFDLTPPAGVAAEGVCRVFEHVVHFQLKK